MYVCMYSTCIFMHVYMCINYLNPTFTHICTDRYAIPMQMTTHCPHLRVKLNLTCLYTCDTTIQAHPMFNEKGLGYGASYGTLGSAVEPWFPDFNKV